MQKRLKFFLVLGFLSFLVFVYLENINEDKITYSINKSNDLADEVEMDSLAREKTRKRVISFNHLPVTKHNDKTVSHLYNQLDSLRLLITIKQEKVKRNNLASDVFKKKQTTYGYCKYTSLIIFTLSLICLFFGFRKNES